MGAPDEQKPLSTDKPLFQEIVRVGGLGGWMSERVRRSKPDKVRELMQKEEDRSENLKKQVREGALTETSKSDKPFQIWVRHQEELQKELQTNKRRIATITTELGHFGVPERRLKQISRLAWAATKTDFTDAEQEERKLLMLKVRFNVSALCACACGECACARCQCQSHANGSTRGAVRAPRAREKCDCCTNKKLRSSAAAVQHGRRKA